MMDSLHLAIALGPLACYLLMLGAIQLGSRPWLTTGTRDQIALAIGLSGFVMAGPLELFMPQWAAAIYGRWVWILLMLFYALVVVFLLLGSRPRLVIYHLPAEQGMQAVRRVVAELDPDAAWAGNCLAMPRWRLECHLQPAANLQTLSIVGTSVQQPAGGWHRLEVSLARELAQLETPRRAIGLRLVAIGTLLATWVLWQLTSDPARVAQSLSEMFFL